MIDFFKDTLRPASLTALLLLITVGVVFVNIPRLARWGRRWLTGLVVLYWALSCPISVNLLARTLTAGYAPIVSATEASGAQAVVLLSAGTVNLRAREGQLPIVTPGTGLRTLEAARMYHLLGSPIVIAPALRSVTPPDRIVPESESKNTHDEAVIVTRMLRERGISRFVIVTSPLHMRRSMAVFAAQGMQPVPAVSALMSQGEPSEFGFVPNELSLRVGDAIVYEWAARLYYWWRGWLS